MTVAFDAATNGTSGGFTHTPVGTPRGVLVLIRMLNAGDVVTGVTYGGSAMAEVPLSPLLASGSEGGSCYGYFLGSSIPTGAQTCTVSVSAGTPRATCYTVTAAADTEVVDTATINETGVTGDRTGTLSLGGRTCFVAEAAWSSTGANTGMNPLSGWTNRQETDEGSEINAGYSYDTIGSSDVSFGATLTTTDDVAILGVAVSEVSASGATGTVEQTLPLLAQAATGTEKFTAVNAQVLPKLAQAAAGDTTSALSATAAQTLPKLTQAVAGAEKFTGAAAQALPKLTQDSAGDVVSTGVAGATDQTLPRLIQAANGAVVVAVSGNVIQLLPSLAQQIAGTVDNHGLDITEGPPGGGGRHKRRRRILLADGRILVPADDEAYRRAVDEIVAGFGQDVPTPSRKARKRLAKAVVQPAKVAPATPVRTLPSEFYTRLENNRTGVLNYAAIQSAWEAYEAQMDEEAVEMLLMVS